MANEISTRVAVAVSGPADGARTRPQVEGAVRQEGAAAGGNALPPQAPGQAPREAGQPSRAQVEEAVSRLRDHVQSLRRELRFSVDEESGHTVIRVIDAETDQVIRQIPPEEVLSIARHLRELRDPEQQGILLRVQA
ncbi:flagellar protein FlaG [Inmirania thermothiophila]|uniref:Flagellar protein FlaG n=1 Tax=Inmirania thermothiophila TaxID=1750597 RepID=A0A3N1Y840_9GAMM|nr:flagellar protein FlaG [Inmirania thermothiophila]ROR34920.1 flagellar protein FlaG [Inmirania thermothiophila]